MLPDAIHRLVAQLAKLPGIGEKTALRLAFHLLRAPAADARGLAAAITDALDRVRFCARCFGLHDGPEGTVCASCADPRRDDRLVCVVEGIADALAIERTREFKGRYHVLQGSLSPLDGVGPEQLRIQELLARLQDSPVEELILATNADIEGEATALYLTRLLKPLGLRVSRLAQGVPFGGELEYADQATLARALAARREL